MNYPPRLPAGKNESKVGAYVQKLLPGFIRGAHIALDLRELIKCERDLQSAHRIYRQLEDSTGRCTHTRQLKKAKLKLETLSDLQGELRTSKRVGTGVAFLTFKDATDAAEFGV